MRNRLICGLRVAIGRTFPKQFDRSIVLGKILYGFDPPLPTGSIPPDEARDVLAKLEHQPFLTTPHPSLHISKPDLVPVVIALKSLADYYQWQDFRQARRYALTIKRLGAATDHPQIEALGWMAYGDTLAQSGRHLGVANQIQQKGADLCLASGDLIGWARTCIGRVGICMEVDRVEGALADAAIASRLLEKFGKHDLQVRLAVNLTRTHYDLGNYREVARVFSAIRPVVERFGKAEQFHLAVLHNNLGKAQLYSGHADDARASFQKAVALISPLEKPGALAIIEQNLAYVDLVTGKLGVASKKLRRLLDNPAEFEGVYQTHTALYLIEYELQVNRPAVALQGAKALLTQLDQQHNPLLNEKAHLWRYIGTARAATGDLSGATAALKTGTELFQRAQAATWAHRLTLQRAQILLQHGRTSEAWEALEPAVAYFDSHNQVGNLARALCLKGSVCLRRAESAAAESLYSQALALAQTHHLEFVLFESHFALGLLSEQKEDIQSAQTHYQNALAIIYRHQKFLTGSLTADYLADKTTPFYKLMGLLLANPEHHDLAFEQLETHRARLSLAYLTNRESLTWHHDRDARPENTVYQTLRRRQQVLTTLIEQFDNRPEEMQGNSRQSLKEELQQCEDALQTSIERLYLEKMGDDGLQLVTEMSLPAVKSCLPHGSLLLSYYTDGERWWLLAVSRAGLERVVELSINATDLNIELADLEFNVSGYLDRMGKMGPAEEERSIESYQKISNSWYQQLIAPLSKEVQQADRLIIIPTSLLHSVPFNTLFDGQQYLIERHEIVLLPAASWLGIPARPTRPGVHIFAHDHDGALPHALLEGALIQASTGGTLFANEAATREQLSRLSGSILHVAAHGEHRFDQPTFSYLELADGRLLFDDLRQFDLDYDLVVLNGCETGQGTVRLDEDVVGLGRGVLSGGARSVIATLWWVEDGASGRLMADFYSTLRTKEPDGQKMTIAEALQRVQKARIMSQEERHPAVWGAYQLIGDGNQIST